MCGRSAVTLCQDDVLRACSRQNKNGKRVKPRWRQAPQAQAPRDYQPSHNVCPGAYTPILFSKSHADYEDAKSGLTADKETEKEDTEDIEIENPWVVQPMKWGLVPSWHAGDSDKGVGYNMINARSDSILTKRTFKGPLEKGRRCVVLVDGYFEWQTKDGKKQPYFIYFPHQPTEGVVDKETVTAEDGEVIPEGWEGKRLLTLAGLFDIWRPKDGSPPVYSYSIITVEADKSLSWIHDRMPAILNGEEEVSAWLDSGKVPLSKAVKDLIRPVGGLQHHAVSTAVNDNKNKTAECTLPIDLTKQKKEEKAASNFMKSWLGKGKRKSTELND